MTFKVGDIVSSKLHPHMGEGEVIYILDSATLAVRYYSYEDYDDEIVQDQEFSDYPNLPDFHYVQIKHAILTHNDYDPTQMGDTDEDI
jgi:hypothetical protein